MGLYDYKNRKELINKVNSLVQYVEQTLKKEINIFISRQILYKLVIDSKDIFNEIKKNV